MDIIFVFETEGVGSIPAWPTKLCLGSLKVEHPPYKWKTAEHYRNEVPMVDSTGVRLGFINLGDRSDGLRRKGS